jgi:hypothetical protein
MVLKNVTAQSNSRLNLVARSSRSIANTALNGPDIFEAA